MAVFRAFKALRPTEEKAAAVAALPYDVVNREEAAAIGKENPDSFLHVDRAEMDLPAETDLYDGKVYQKAKENLSKMEENGILVQDIQKIINGTEARGNDRADQDHSQQHEEHGELPLAENHFPFSQCRLIKFARHVITHFSDIELLRPIHL